jgi:hypothetical protein
MSFREIGPEEFRRCEASWTIQKEVEAWRSQRTSSRAKRSRRKRRRANDGTWEPVSIVIYGPSRKMQRIRRAARSEPYLAGGVPRSQFDGQSVDLVGEPYAERRVVFPRMNPDTNQSPRFRCFHIGACVTPLGSG